MNLSDADINALFLTLKVASLTTFLLVLIGIPLAWWLANTQSRFKNIVNTLVAMPLILPPTVIGFYLLIAMGPDGVIGKITHWVGIGSLAFTFSGIVLGSIIYSLPFVVQPIQNAIESVGKKPIEVATTLGANPLDCFFSVVLPQARSGLITAIVLGFAHTVGEFGVVLMIGGNIPEITKVASVQIYEHVELLQYNQAHWLSAILLVFSCAALMFVYSFKSKNNQSKKVLSV